MKRLALTALVALAALGFAPNALAAAKLRVLHAAPDVPAVTVYLNGQAAVPSLDPLAATPYVKVKAGTYHVAVSLRGRPASEAALTATITLRNNTRYTAVARGLLSAGTAELALQQDIGKAPRWFSALRVWHLSPDAPNVDVYVYGFRILSNVPYKAASKYFYLPPGSYFVRVNVAGTQTSVFSDFVTLRRGTAYTAAALGSVAGTGESFRVSVLVDDSRRPWKGDRDRDDDHDDDHDDRDDKDDDDD